ncbi:hypothetical protein MMC07_005118 [Pseudocyphellaria aurata]|nr:hypothetical protein [Pseudocyphellaria aurata]
MSLPTTPTRFGTLSAISTPSDSPYGDANQELTPRSKVKAMLAAFDSESDSDHLDRAQESHINLATTNGAHYLPQASSPAKQRYPSNVHDESEGEEIDRVTTKPRGKLASRLRDHDTARSIYTDESIDTNAYERIKRKLLQGRSKKSEESAADSVQDKSASREVVQTTNSPPHSSQLGRGSASSCSTANSNPGSPKFSPNVSTTPIPTALAESLRAQTDSDSDSDLPPDPLISTKVQQLVARKREELRAKKEANAREKAEKRRKRQIRSKTQPPGPTKLNSVSGVSDGDSDNQAIESRLTEQARPTRKPTKKELEETNRETQRMRRNLQWTHQAKTKKKISKESFLTRFNLRASPQVADDALALTSSAAVSSAPTSDVEDKNFKESPPTSPEMAIDPSRKSTSLGLFHGEDAVLTVEDVQAVLPTGLYDLDQSLLQLQEHDEQHEGSMDTRDVTATTVNSGEVYSQQMKIRPSKSSLRCMTQTFDSDSDLEILPSKKSKRPKFDIFDRLPSNYVNEERSLQTLRALAHINSPGKQKLGPKPSMAMSDMQTSLQRRARKQAAQERAEKIQDLKDRGVLIQTAEERERDQAEVEGLVDKARREAARIMQEEKQAARKEKLANGEFDHVELISDEDEDYQENDAEESEIEISGSDEESVHDDEHMSDSEAEAYVGVDDSKSRESSVARNNSTSGQVFDIEASEVGEDEEREEVHSENDHDPGDETINVPQAKRRRPARLIVEDDAEDEEAEKLDIQQAPVISFGNVQNPPFPVLPVPNVLPMGLTQAFAATMADTQTEPQLNENADPEQEQDSLAFLGPMPEPNFPMYNFEDSQQMVPDSQNGNFLSDVNGNADQKISGDIELHFSQDQIQPLEDSEDAQVATQFSEIPDPTQDAGFGMTSPVRNRFVSVPPSTIDTVLLSGVARSSPGIKKRGRLHRRVEVTGDDGAMSDDDVLRHNAPIDAFNIMAEAARKPLQTMDAFDRNNSEAKGMVEEQAQESEDEYAGLGGASDEESADEEDEEVRKMIDEGDVKVDERKLAAFYADKERASDEKAVEKLFKDINNGMLRRKRGAEFDLSDSDDDVEARQRAKRREFAKMRKALLSNENVGKIAQDPKKLPFLRAIEDRGDDSMSFLEQPDESFQMDLGSQEGFELQTRSVPATESDALTRRRPLQNSIPDNSNRLPPATRRTPLIKKPSSLADIRKSVSFLIEEPDSLHDHLQSASSPQSSDNESIQNPQKTFASRRRTNPVIDRLLLKRAESSKTSSATSRFAFHDPSSDSAPSGFQVPTLLRRATTSQIPHDTDKYGISTGNAGTERAAGSGEKSDSIRVGGSRKSSIGYFARNRERGMGHIQEAERRRSEGLRKLSMGRIGLSGLASGTFD